MLGDLFVECIPAESLLDNDPPCTANTVLYLVSSMQYLICCLALSTSKPFRKSIFTNKLFAFSALLMLAYQSVQVVYDLPWNNDLMGLTSLP